MDLSASVGDIQFVAFDFETTGLNSASDRIVEFGAVRFRGSQAMESFAELANPGMPIGPDAAAVSGISDAVVLKARPVAKVLPDFLDFIAGDILIAHNAPFDMGFLRAAVQEAGLGEVVNPVIDTQLLAIKAFPRRKSYGLQNLAAELGLPLNNAHRARDDAEMCMRLFLACVSEMSFMGDLPLEEVLTGPLTA
jgi:DNA polymerase-3 subunit epsilon